MRVHATTLPLDVLDTVLAFAPDYATLTAAILTCKTFHRAFTGRATGILRDLAMQLYGGRVELVHETIRAIHVENDVRYLNRWARCDRERFPSVLKAQFDDDALRRRHLQRKEAKELCKRIEDACALEAVFSTRYKDGVACDTSRLDEVESKNFNLAVHRLEMLLSLTRKQHAGSGYWLDRETRYDLFHRRFSNEEVYHMHEVNTFLIKCVEEASRHHGPTFERYERAALILGTKNIMSVIRDPLTFKFPRSAYRNYSESVRADFVAFIWPKGDFKRIPREIRPIVIKADGANICCQGCGRRNGGALWNDSNWHLLPRYFWLENLHRHLPGKLAKNEHELTLLSAYLGVSFDNSNSQTASESVRDSKITLEELLSCLFKFKFDLPHLTPQTWLCATCLDNVIAPRLWVWWAFAKGETNIDCQFGIDCSHQIHKRRHTVLYNHACPKTHDARKTLRDAVNRALTAGRGVEGIGAELDVDVVAALAWRTIYDAAKKNREMTDEDYYQHMQNCQQIQWASQKYEDMFLAEKKAHVDEKTVNETEGNDI